MSDASSGGVSSSVSRTHSMIELTGSAMASRISALLSVMLLGSPDTRSRPRSSVYSSGSSGRAVPSSSLISSAERSPTARLCVLRVYAAIASSSS